MSCPQCFTGHINPGLPTGKMTTMHGRKTYVAEPRAGTAAKGIIIIVPDAFGLPFVNNKILADHYASGGGFKVYLPDFMDGKHAAVWIIDSMAKMLNTSLSSWLTKPWDFGWTLYGFVPFLISNRFSVSMPKVTSFFEAVRATEPSALPIGAAGFCWGGKHVITLASGAMSTNGKPLVDAVFTAHPSGLAIPQDLEAVKLPVSVAIGDEDIVVGMDDVAKIKAVLEKKEDVVSEVKVYPGAGHGFAVRADPRNVKVVSQSGEAEEQALTFFQKSFQAAG